MSDFSPTNHPTAISSTCTLQLGDGSGYAILATCTGAPPTTASTFQHGCIMYQTDSGTSSQAVYQNIGSIAAPSWSLMDTASASFTLPAAATDASTTTGTSFGLTQNAITTGVGTSVAANALTTGQGMKIASSATAITTTGRVFLSSHSGTTGTSATLNEFTSAATDETIVLTVGATGALALGKVLNVSGAAVTTGTLVSVANADALTTGAIANLVSNSADTTARNLVKIVNDNTAAVGAVPLYLQQDAVGTTNFKTLMLLGTIGIYVSNETSPNTALTAAKGSICLNGSATGQAFWNTDGATAWTALA